MAINDGALYGIKTIADLYDQQIPEGDNELILPRNENVAGLPVLRIAKQNGVSEEPLSRAIFDRIFKAVLEQSGYFGKATVHAIRRYLGKKVNERYTEVERSQHITQADPRVYGDSYVANTSSVDGKSAFLNEVAQHDHIDFFQSFAQFREEGLPTNLPAERETAVRKDPALLILEARVAQLIREAASSKGI